MSRKRKVIIALATTAILSCFFLDFVYWFRDVVVGEGYVPLMDVEYNDDGTISSWYMEG